MRPSCSRSCPGPLLLARVDLVGPPEAPTVIELELIEPDLFLGLGDGTIIFTHTTIDPPLEGRGLGSALAAYVLDDARARGLSVVPECAFIAAYIDRHPEYADLVS